MPEPQKVKRLLGDINSATLGLDLAIGEMLRLEDSADKKQCVEYLLIRFNMIMDKHKLPIPNDNKPTQTS